MVVVNMQTQGGSGAAPHRRFEEARALYAADGPSPHPKASYVDMKTRTVTLTYPDSASPRLASPRLA